MRKLGWLGLGALLLGSCGLVGTREPLSVSKVSFPSTVSPQEPLTVGVNIEVASCTQRDQQLTLLERTPTRLSLSGTFRRTSGIGLACTAAVTERTLTYTDAGTPPRTGPFEIVVNGKSWGKVNIK